MGVLASHTLPENKAVVTTNLSINYLATATEGHLHAQASISHKGLQTIVTTGNVKDDGGETSSYCNRFIFHYSAE